MGQLPNISASACRTLDQLLVAIAAERGYREDAVGDSFGKWLYDLCEAVRCLQPLETKTEGASPVSLILVPGSGPVSCDLDVLVSGSDITARHQLAFVWHNGIVGNVLRTPATMLGTTCTLMAEEKNLKIIVTGGGHVKAAASLRRGTKIV